MNQIIKTLIICFLIISCNGKVKNNKEQFLKEEIKKPTNDKIINYLDEKYRTGYHISTDASSSSDHPMITYVDCQNEGYFAMHFVPKEDTLRVFWADKYFKIYKYEYDDMDTENKNIGSLLKNNYNLYNIFIYQINKEYLEDNGPCSQESVYTKDNSIANIYLLNQTTNNWNLIKQIKEETLPQYHDNNYFLKLFPKLFPIEKKLKINDIKNSNKTENLNLFKNFIFKFSISKFEDENGNEEQKIKINLVNKQTNKIQKIEFIPKSLVIEFDVSPSNCISYFDMEKLIINSHQQIEGGNMLITLDVNFDGLEDFAIINYQGSNGGPQYAYYVQKPNNQFVLDSYLTENVRFCPFETNRNQKILTIVHPSGCCQIQTYKFQIQPNGEWKDIYSNLEDL